MLILTRKINSSIVLTNLYDEQGNKIDDVEVHIYSDNRIGIKADPSIDIYRGEVLILDE